MKIKKIVVITLLVLCIGFDIFFPSKVELKKATIDDLYNVEELIQDEEKNINELIDFDVHVTVKLLDDGYNIYVPEGLGYRYGPSIMKHDDGTIDMYYSSTGNNSTEWDYIRYRHYDGEFWSSEEIVLRPTPGSLDHYSVCDPGAMYFDGYYYLGYTSTTNSEGMDNNIFVARSENPDGPFEKWDGESWGGDPVPIIQYNGDHTYWGSGEISFVVMEDKIYCYYTDISENGDVTKVAIADKCENWPSTIEEIGVIYSKINVQDSSDVAYVEGLNKFMAVAIEQKMTHKSGISVYESDDGINFVKTDTVYKKVSKYSHNMGISKDENGHINLDDNLIIGYAYGETWAKWALRLHNAELNFYEGEITYPSSGKKNTLRGLDE